MTQAEIVFDERPSDAEDALLVPARMLNEWTYCPRLAVLEWVHGEWAENADTTQGRRAHLKADTGPGPALPDAGNVDEERSMTTRRVLLGSKRLGLTAKIDILELGGGAVVPVEIKKGKRPHVEEDVRLPERVQVCAQALLLREAGYRCDEGAVWFAGSRERVRVRLTDELVATTTEGIAGLLAAVDEGRLPEPLVDSPKCTRCSLRPICLPDELNLLRGDVDDIAATPPPPVTPALPLYVQTPGAWVGKEGDVLRIGKRSEILAEIALDEVSELVLAGPVGLSTPAVHELLRRDIPVAWMTTGFWYLGSTGAQGVRSSTVREAQYAAALDPERRLEFSRALVAAKIRNQRTILRRGWRGDDAERKGVLDKLARIVKRAEAAPAVDILRGYEGEAAALYFRALPDTFTEAVAELPDFAFDRRNRRPPADPVNACLSFAYALLTRTLSAALATVGLDPWKGLYHVDRPGRPSLALDMIEPYRPIIADSAMLLALNNGELAPHNFVHGAGGCNLTDAGRKVLLSAYERRLDQETTHPVFGYKVSMRRMLHVQSRLLARHLLGEIAEYPHYVPR